MKAYTIESPGRLVPGIAMVGGGIDVGARRSDSKRVLVPVDTRSTVRDGRLVEAPGRGALLLLRDQAGALGSWHVRAAQPEERWDAMLAAEGIPNALDRILAAERVRARYPHGAPVGWYEFARGHEPTGAPDRRASVHLYGYLEAGAAFEIRRRGRLDGTASVFLVSMSGDELCVTDPCEAAQKRWLARRPS